VAGLVQRLLVAEGQEAKVGQAFAVIETDAAAEAAPAAPVAAAATESAPTTVATPPAATSPAGLHHAPAAPSVRRFAREVGVDVDTVAGTGPHNRVSLDDVKRHLRDMNARRAGPAGLALPPLPDFAQWGAVEAVKMSAVRQQTAAHLALCWSAIPHVTIHDKADITELEKLRRRYADRAERLGGKLTLAVMVCKVGASALKLFPKFNASADMERRQILLKKYCNLGVAMATERGLLVPVIRDADRKNMVELAVEIGQVAERARKGHLALADMAGGTFTVTNLGRFGGTYFTPIVNYPEVAILGMGRTFQEPPLVAGGETRTLLPLSLSFDHRVIDGADGAVFLRWVIEAIEQPLLLALEG